MTFVERKNKQMHRMCWDKQRYDTEEIADAYGKLYNYRHKENLPYRAYFCAVCLKWHLTTKPKIDRFVSAKQVQKTNNIYGGEFNAPFNTENVVREA